MSGKIHSLLLLCIFCIVTVAVISLQQGEAAAAALAQVNSPLPTAPANDNFGRAKKITMPPYSDSVDITNATRQSREPVPSCAAYYPSNRTLWYAYTAPTSGVLVPSVGGNSPALAVYTGSTLANLSERFCTAYGSGSALTVVAGTTYYFQIIDVQNYGGYIYFSLDVAPPPSVNLYISPWDPSSFDTIYFNSSIWDPANQSIQSWFWNFGDGSTSTESYPSHRYAADGDYTASLTVTTSDGRVGSASTVLAVRTHDVAITKLARPATATVGQTKRLVISVANTRYPEEVTVELYKSVPGGYRYIGFLQQFVDVKPKAKPTDFYLSYTFTAEDAQVGKVIFKAIANPVNARDAFPADNEFISFAVKVTPKKAGSANTADEAVTSAALDDMSDYIADDISNVDEIFDITNDEAVGETSEETPANPEVLSGEQNFISYLPLVNGQ